MLTGDLWADPGQSKNPLALKEDRRILSILNEAIDGKILSFSECHTLTYYFGNLSGSKTMMFKRVFIGKPSSAQLQEGSLAPGVDTKICFPFLTSSSWISWKGWQKPLDLQGSCQLSMTRFQRSREEPCMWLWSLSSVGLAAWCRNVKETKQRTSQKYSELPSLYCQV